MDYFLSLFNKTPVPPLTEEVINDTVNTNDNQETTKTEQGINKTVNTNDNQETTKKLPLFRTANLPLKQDIQWRNLPKLPTGRGGRKIKNKKKHNKLSRRRRHPDSKKNRKSMKRK
jgi:hypothetical protein